MRNSILIQILWRVSFRWL